MSARRSPSNFRLLWTLIRTRQTRSCPTRRRARRRPRTIRLPPWRGSAKIRERDDVAVSGVFVYQLPPFPVSPEIVSFLYGRSEEENLQVAPQHAPRPSRPAGVELQRMPELRRDQAAAPSLQRLRLL